MKRKRKKVPQLTRLTPEQEARIPEHFSRWAQIAFSCEPCNVEETKRAICEAYRIGGLKPPKIWVLADSPISGILCDAILAGQLSPEEQTPAYQFGSMEKRCLRMEENRGHLYRYDAVDSDLWGKLLVHYGCRLKPRPTVLAQNLTVGINRVLREYCSGSTNNRTTPETVWKSVELSLTGVLPGRLWPISMRVDHDQAMAMGGRTIRSCYNFGNLSTTAFFYEVCGVKQLQMFEPIMRIARNCGWWIPRWGSCVIQHRPVEIRLSPAGLPHSETGMAVRYRDGWGVWAIDGVVADEQLVLRPETQTVQQIDAEENNDRRAIRMQRFGLDRYLAESGAQVVDEGHNDIEGTHEALMRLPNGRKFFWPTCPSGRICPPLPIPKEIETREQARTWLAGDQPFRVLART